METVGLTAHSAHTTSWHFPQYELNIRAMSQFPLHLSLQRCVNRHKFMVHISFGPLVCSVTNLPTNPLVLTALSSLASPSSSSSLGRNGTASFVNPNEIKCEICETGSEEDAVFLSRVCAVLLCWLPEEDQRVTGRQDIATHHALQL